MDIPRSPSPDNPATRQRHHSEIRRQFELAESQRNHQSSSSTAMDFKRFFPDALNQNPGPQIPSYARDLLYKHYGEELQRIHDGPGPALW